MASDSPLDSSLTRRLEEAQAELTRLQDLAAEVPELMEQKFRQELQQVRARNQALVADRQYLLNQLPMPADPVAALPEVAAKRRRFSRLAWYCLVPMVAAAAAIGLIHGRLANQPLIQTGALAPSPAQQPGEAGGSAGQLLPVLGSDQSLVELESREAVWVEVSDRVGELLLKDTLNGGDPRRIRLRAGLRLFAARPEVVRFRVDEGPWQPWPQQALATGVLELVPRNP